MYHAEILTAPQRRLLPLVKAFRGQFILVGGTALALQIGHRQSIDFDLATEKTLLHNELRQKVISFGHDIRTIVETPTEYTVMVDGVKITFFHYPFQVEASGAWDEIADLPDILTLAAMKAYALGRRAKWKDYVDLFFVLQGEHSLRDIVERAETIFKTEFSEKNFRSQLAYFADLDRSEQVIFLPGYERSDEEIEQILTKQSLEG